MNRRRDFINTDRGPVACDAVTFLDTSMLEKQGYVTAHHGHMKSRVTGFFAIEAVMLLKPGALEGKRLRWHKNAWLFHNVVAHPVMQFMAVAGGLLRPVAPDWSRRLYRGAMQVHDATVPVPRGFRHEAQPEEINHG